MIMENSSKVQLVFKPVLVLAKTLDYICWYMLMIMLIESKSKDQICRLKDLLKQ